MGDEVTREMKRLADEANADMEVLKANHASPEEVMEWYRERRKQIAQKVEELCKKHGRNFQRF